MTEVFVFVFVYAEKVTDGEGQRGTIRYIILIELILFLIGFVN